MGCCFSGKSSTSSSGLHEEPTEVAAAAEVALTNQLQPQEVVYQKASDVHPQKVVPQVVDEVDHIDKSGIPPQEVLITERVKPAGNDNLLLKIMWGSEARAAKYYVEARIAGEDEWKQCEKSNTHLKTTAIGSYTATVEEVPDDSRYKFRIVAVDGEGNKYASPPADDYKKETVLEELAEKFIYAIIGEEEKQVDEILAASDQATKTILVNAVSKYRNKSALALAIGLGKEYGVFCFNRAIFKKLIEYGANINQAYGIGGETLLMEAAASGIEEIVHILLCEGADRNLRDKHGNTALWHFNTESGLMVSESVQAKFAIMLDDELSKMFNEVGQFDHELDEEEKEEFEKRHAGAIQKAGLANTQDVMAAYKMFLL